MHMKTLYFTYVFGGAPVQPIVIIFCISQDLTDVINLAKFCIDRFSEGKIWGSPVRNRNGPNTTVYGTIVLTCDKAASDVTREMLTCSLMQVLMFTTCVT